jgi:hypothetical protein
MQFKLVPLIQSSKNIQNNANQFFTDMQAECSDDVMKLDVRFNDTFNGLIYSAGKIGSGISLNDSIHLGYF